MHNDSYISPREKRQTILLLILLIIIGGFVLYGKPREVKNDTIINTAPKVKGPTAPPPSNNEITR